MRYGRIRDDAGFHWALFEGDEARVLSDAPWAGGVATGEVRVPGTYNLAAPVTPSKIVCVGRNYRAHARELGHEVPAEPLLFLKPPSSVVGPDDTVALPPQSDRVEHEGELAVVLARTLTDATPAEALAAVFGYTCADDVTARDLQRRDVQFTRGKGFDTFCPVGPWIEMDEACARGDSTVTTRVNGAVRQHGRVGEMVFPIGELLAYISEVMTLEPGDLVLTGTPEGVGPLTVGDRVEVEISGLGTLVHGVGRRLRRSTAGR